MRYYHVWVRSDQYRGAEPLTYAYTEMLAPGTVVIVPLRTQKVIGFISAEVARPRFKLKDISEVLPVPTLPQPSLLLARWLQKFYKAPVGIIAGLFLPPNVPSRYIKLVAPIHTETLQSPAVTWTDEQKQALAMINSADTYLLHGRTGSGKTNIYIELSRRSIADSRSVLILSPEIGLTSQLANEFRRTFGERVVVLHSQLTQKERTLIWLRTLTATEPLIIIGPRSALFSPLRDIGLIVVDESHDSAYKQEQPPYYHAVRVAAELRQVHKATLILGSATPSISDYYLAEAKQKPIIRLKELARKNNQVTKQIHLVDLKDSSQFSRSSHISLALIDAMKVSLERGEQTLLYLNRRGTARVTVCDNCGWQACCPNCDLPLTYHSDTFRLRCHTCGYNRSPIMACPVCSNTSVILKSFGTKAIVEDAQRLFPGARIVRFDTDTAKSERLEQRYEEIINGDVDILIGTQMLAKGLDLPRLSTLGIILADSSLYLPDYTAQERTYQLLTQVIGRIGRGHVDSQAVIQTYYPDSPLLKTAIGDDWRTFYEQELAERRQYLFPPFCYLLKLSCRRASRESAERAAKDFQRKLEETGLPVRIEGPSPAFHEKAGASYQWQLVVKAKNRVRLLDIITLLPSGWSYDIDPSDLL